MAGRIYGVGGKEIPAADARVYYPDGSFGPLMFHYLADDRTDLYRLARANGFELATCPLEFDDAFSEDSPAWRAYEDGADMAEIARLWQPTPPPGDGWVLSGMWDTEDGPVAIFLKK